MEANVGKMIVSGNNINVPVPWGHIAVKECGNLEGRPIFLMHGWLDNCGSFQPILPYFTANYRMICIDAPGHGLSSHYPPGMMYQTLDCLINISRVAKYFNIKSFGIIGHSMGANYGLLFAATHPEAVDFLIMLDIAKPISRPLEATVTRARKGVDDFLSCEENSIQKLPKEHTLETATKRMIEGRYQITLRHLINDNDHTNLLIVCVLFLNLGSNSLISKDNMTYDGCQYLLPRALKEVKEHTYIFTRDMRLYPSSLYGFTNDVIKEFAKSIVCPHLVILADKCSGFEVKQNIDLILDEYKANNKQFVLKNVDTTHHGHLTEPEKVAPIIKSFLEQINSTLSQ